MSSTPSFNPPVLTPVGSVDVTSATSGTTMYSILFDAALCTTGNVLMFEYKIQPSTVDVPEPDTITLGYVNVEKAINTGICNQWTVAVPATNNVYNPSIALDISMRVYSGLTDTASQEIAVSPWSNTVPVHVPPEQPTIYAAFYNDDPYVGDELWINMPVNNSYNYSELSFIVAYYYQNTSGDTVWSVSEPLTTIDVPYAGTMYKQLNVRSIGSVDTTNEAVYVAVYAVYSYINVLNSVSNRYYSVSEISSTYEAMRAGNGTAPTIDSVDYDVYSTRAQTMVVNWSPPENSFIPVYNVTKYILQQSVNNGTTWNDVSSTIPSTQFSYTVDVSSYNCYTYVSFRVIAVIVGDIESPPSNVDGYYIFKYATAPTSVIVNWASIVYGDDPYVSPSLIDVAATFTVANPYNAGCGTIVGWVAQVKDLSGNVIAQQNVAYTSGTTTYPILFNDVAYTQYGSVTVFMKTVDSNSSNILDGASSIGFFDSDGLPIIDNVVINSSRTSLTFDAYTQNGLARYARFLWVTNEDGIIVRYEKPFFTNNSPSVAGESVTITALTNGVIQHSYVFTPAFFGISFIPDRITVAVANSVGISVENIPNSA